ncbi:MAG: site-specific integrase, partial [Muribaculaceae bacterium]|nr:site-specific integrase [Muribaculaceae bacterium]
CAYNLILSIHLLPLFADATQITEKEVQGLVLDKLSGGLSRKSVKNIIAILKAIVRYGEKHCGFPGENWDIRFPTETFNGKLPILSIENHRKLMRNLIENPSSLNIGILIALCTGMRIGEICALRWADVDLRHRTISVKSTLSRIYNIDTKRTEQIVSSPKTRNSYREVPICRELYLALQSIKNNDKSNSFVIGGTERAKEPRLYREYFNRLLKRLKIPHIVFHGLRHSFATRCIECMCDYKTLSVILGHSNVATTMNLYVHPNQDQKKRCVDRLSKYINIR